MPMIISIVGKSHSGKTTLLEKLVAELKGRGLRVVAIKHADDFELDREGKDSWRFSRAGSEAVVISSPQKLALLKETGRDLGLRELASLVPWGYDLVLAEGFKQSNAPKIEVYRREQGGELLTPPGQLLALVTDEPLEVGVPQFAKDDIAPLADLIEKAIREQARGEEVEMVVNGTSVPLNPFISDLMARVLVAMSSSLKGVKDIKSLQISLRRGT